MTILVEINVKGFLWKCAKKTFIYGQNHKVASIERYWTHLTKQKLSGVIKILLKLKLCLLCFRVSEGNQAHKTKSGMKLKSYWKDLHESKGR